MTKQSGVYKCAVCGNIVEVVHPGAGELVCCGQPMQLLTENTTDASPEDVRWGIDLALNGGKHRTLPESNFTSSTTTEAWQEASLAGFLAAEALLKREREGK